jgi:hypothetical protein
MTAAANRFRALHPSPASVTRPKTWVSDGDGWVTDMGDGSNTVFTQVKLCRVTDGDGCLLGSPLKKKIHINSRDQRKYHV